MRKDNNTDTALMLLEMGLDSANTEHGTLQDYAEAAHSFIQAARNGRLPSEKARELADKAMAPSPSAGATVHHLAIKQRTPAHLAEHGMVEHHCGGRHFHISGTGEVFCAKCGEKTPQHVSADASSAQ